ncbi:MAG: 4-hydroxy-3-methylbut-2-enyl diphosphate reductase [Oscillospiraceae bacterium]|jgi:4-hydroxy-3-methylbut-2-enyl diphosphate reductase|nr:4-hydroxy-3-methylbut-2-enyl diphosphate reductase [Oscillospiraceae bacterium]
MKLKYEIILAATAGMCGGVQNAVKIAENAAKEQGGAFILGELVHNKDTVDSLAAKGAVSISRLEDCPIDKPLIIRSHGEPKATYDAAVSLKLQIIDATCPYVSKIHKIVAEYSSREYGIIIAGERNHPEIIGVCGWCDPKAQVVVAESAKEVRATLEKQEVFCANNTILVFQTTFDLAKRTNFVETVKNLCTNVKIFDTICISTLKRQEEARTLSHECAAMLIVGDRHSSNTRKLFDICVTNTHAVLFDGSESLRTALHLDDIIAEYRSKGYPLKIGITAGASTPGDKFKEVHLRMNEELGNNALDNDEGFDFMAEVDRTCKRVYIGNRVKATVISAEKNAAVVDIGTKHTGYIPADELTNDPDKLPEDIVKPGDVVDCVVTQINDNDGVVYLSKKKVDQALGMEKIAKASETGENLDGVVAAAVKSGVVVTCDGAKVFIPASQTGLRRGGKLEDLVKKTVKFKIIEVNEARGRVVGSIRQAMSEVNEAARIKFWETVEIGKKFTGEVKSIENYGVFVNLDGVDGMIHLSELSWERVKHPSDVVSIGDKLDVYIKNFNPETRRIALGYKDPSNDPWAKFVEEYHPGTEVKATIVSITAYGAFASIVPGIDGLIHITQLTNGERVNNVAQFVTKGQEVDVVIIEIDNAKHRVSLSIKEAIRRREAENAAEYAESQTETAEPEQTEQPAPEQEQAAE